jgi:dienelactone hydrolase
MLKSKRAAIFAGAFWLFSVAAGAQCIAKSTTVSFPGEKLWPDTQIVTVPGVLSMPSSEGPFPAVVLLPNCGGAKSTEFAEFWPKYLNEIGYATLNVDHFTPRKAKKCTKKFKLNFKTVAQDAYGALNYLAGVPGVDKERIGVLGSSLGAHAINWFAGLNKETSRGLKFRAAVSLYPSNCRRMRPGPGMVPLAIIMGDKEKGVATCRSLGSGSSLSLTILPGVYHGFDQLSATPLKKGVLRTDIVGNKRLYNKAATQKAQVLVKEFLAARLSEAAPPEQAEKPDTPKLTMVGGKDPYRAVSRRDSDGDGKVSAAEWDRSPNVFSKIDADGDGFLTPQEFFDHWTQRQ